MSTTGAISQLLKNFYVVLEPGIFFQPPHPFFLVGAFAAASTLNPKISESSIQTGAHFFDRTQTSVADTHGNDMKGENATISPLFGLYCSTEVRGMRNLIS